MVEDDSPISWGVRMRTFWPRHARRAWTPAMMPVRLAGTLPWVSRLHLAVHAAIGLSGALLTVAALLTDEPVDIASAAVTGVAGTTFAAIALTLAVHTRRSFSVVVAPQGVFTSRPASGVWLGDIVQGDQTAAAVQTITAIRLIPIESEYDLIGGDINLTLPVRRLALVAEGSGTPTLAGLTFSANPPGERRAQTAGQFLAACFRVTFHPNP